MINENDCRNRREEIAALVLGELEPKAANELRGHIESCQICKSLYRKLTDEEETIRSTFQTIADKGEVLKSSLIEQLDQKEPAITIGNHWGDIKKSPVTKIAAAAVIIIACFTGLHFWNSTGSGIALADVLTRIEQVTAYMYQMRLTRTRAGEEITDKSVSTSTVLVSREYGIRAAYKRADPNKGEIAVYDTYLLPPKKSIIFIDHKEKNYIPIKFEEGKIGYYKDEYNEPHTIIKQILACDHVSLGQLVIDGVTAEGFHTTDLNYKGGFFGQDDYFVGGYKKVDVKLWVDVKTFLPVRLEEDVVTVKDTHIHQLCYDFRWNVIVNSADFEPNIPDDYTSQMGDFIIPATSEENAVKGLKLFGDLLDKYPDVLERQMMEETLKEWRQAFGDIDSYDGLSNDEKTERTSKLVLVAVTFDFYAMLVSEDRDPAYYGEVVHPGEADKVLIRWKLDNGQYRVIFGDLSAKAVSAEELAELEKQ